MKAYRLILSIILLVGSTTLFAQEKPLRVIVIGAHPDDCEVGAGGLAILYANQGHAVKFVSMTNGDKGHVRMKGKELAKHRYEESMEAARKIGVTYEILDIPDGELMATLENRHEVIRLIREWEADIVISHRPNTYHPDHRYTGVLVQDAAFLVTVPNIVSKVPALKKNPLFLYFSDNFQQPNPFRPDIVVDVTSVLDGMVDLLDAHASQFYEWLPWIMQLDEPPTGAAERRAWLRAWRLPQSIITDEIEKQLLKRCPHKKLSDVKRIESFEICEYGRRVTDDEIHMLFPILCTD
ncbi:PIG-L deacetylase family protein [Parapedobacter tibetensis]|uniref:PIG-L deacetylase family protein n=1 Tax=Parapedobacter tibetensis TaxID=2972951 RepID=UPI00214D65F1|nr:PIG-L family deacetylase [Parapedobacter tibetensis]